ncbi:MAG: heme-copper oxidase subunit III [Chloroflexi bacterium CFX4]|nr:heme-copper oxidase subunit III [Chloroflexi bacterium CFX4]MDL1923873.1 heme-copper oxidase subunit III [Chloroflexi bacterium CFX3]
MTANFAKMQTAFDHDQFQQAQALKNARLGLLLWRFANGMAFVFFVFANLLMRNVQPSWPPPGVERLEVTLPILITIVILLSGFTASRTLKAVRASQLSATLRFGLATLALGVVFFVGLLAASAQVPPSGAYSSIVLAMNTFHGLHVVVAALILGVVLLRVRRGHYSAEKHWGVEAAVVFWHFVDAMWLFFFAFIYVL